MRVVETIQSLKAALAGAGQVGFVPTMGYLHEGHASLLRRARQENQTVVLSIFVNPTQFGPTEDLSTYPRDLQRDCQLAEAAGADIVFVPTPQEIYPAGFATRIEVEGAALPLEGEKRPGHFSGVATVVLKLLNLVMPARAYFGEKDFQQVAVVRQLVRDLNHPTEIVACPTQREPSGLAMSSRNSYFTPEQKAQADVLYRALQASRKAFADGEPSAAKILEAGRVVLASQEGVNLEYFTLVDADSLHPVEVALDGRNLRLLVAARFQGVRLIDNMGLL